MVIRVQVGSWVYLCFTDSVFSLCVLYLSLFYCTDLFHFVRLVSVLQYLPVFHFIYLCFIIIIYLCFTAMSCFTVYISVYLYTILCFTVFTCVTLSLTITVFT